MKTTCRYCKSNNEIGSRFCRECGRQFDILERWEPYKLKPSSLFIPIRKQLSNIEIFFRVLLAFVVVSYLWTSCCDDGYWMWWYDYTFDDTDPVYFLSESFFAWIWLILALIAPIGLIVTFYKTNTARVRRIRNATDFIQADLKQTRYVFYIKGESIGLIDTTSYQIAIPAIYDVLAWRDVDEILYAQIEDKQIVVDVKGNILYEQK